MTNCQMDRLRYPRERHTAYWSSDLAECYEFCLCQLLASFSNFIVPDLDLTNTEFGLLTG